MCVCCVVCAFVHVCMNVYVCVGVGVLLCVWLCVCLFSSMILTATGAVFIYRCAGELYQGRKLQQHKATVPAMG